MFSRLPFDRVVVQTAEGQQELSLQQFSAIPLAARVRALLEQRVSFFRGNQQVATQEALTALRQQS